MWVKRRLDPFETARLKAVHLDYVTFTTESERHYPDGQTASHVLGGVNRDELGAAGIERALDKALTGHDGEERLVADVKRRGIESHMDSVPRAGTDSPSRSTSGCKDIAERELKAGA